MTTLGERINRGMDYSPRWSWPDIERAILSIPLARFGAALRLGDCADDGLKIARATMADDIRRMLIQIDEEVGEHS